MKLFSFNAMIEKLSLVAKRFPVSILMVIGLSVLLFWEINGNVEDIILVKLMLFFSVGTFVGVVVALFAEDFVNNLKTCAATLIAVLLWGVYCYFLPDTIDKTGKVIEVAVLCGTSFFALFFISFLKKNKDKSFWNFTTQTLFQMVLAEIFASILFGGLALALLAINVLFNVEISDKVYGNLAIVCFALFQMIYFLSNIPNKIKKHDDGISYHKALKILALYILTPILAVYAIILYVYLFKIILIWELPDGWVSWLVSTLALGGLLVITLLYPIRVQGGNKTVAFLSRWFGLLILPLLVLMSIGIFRRIGDYGITINRCYMLLLNLWFYGIYIYLFLTNSKSVKWILISFIGISLLSSIGPWSVANVVKCTLTKELKMMLNNEKPSLHEASVLIENMEQQDKDKFKNKLRYLDGIYGLENIQPFFSDAEDLGFYAIVAKLGLSQLYDGTEFYEKEEGKFFSFDKCVRDNEIWNGIGDFDTFIPVEYYSSYSNSEEVEYSEVKEGFEIKLIGNNRVFFLPLKDIVKNGEQHTELIQGEDFIFLVRDCSGYYYEARDSIEMYKVKGYLFYK